MPRKKKQENLFDDQEDFDIQQWSESELNEVVLEYKPRQQQSEDYFNQEY